VQFGYRGSTFSEPKQDIKLPDSKMPLSNSPLRPPEHLCRKIRID